MADHHGSPLRIGLTGGIANGKSTVAQAFTALGVPVFSADDIARELTAVGMPALDGIREQFGTRVFGKDGELDRRRLREIVFADDKARARLERILHPPIRERLQELALGVDAEYCVLEVPLLEASDRGPLVDRVLVVDAPDGPRVERLVARDGIDTGLAQRMLASQPDLEARASLADDLIDNSGAPGDIAPQVAALHALYLDIARHGDPGRPGIL